MTNNETNTETPTVLRVLRGHVSAETAYVVDDYPYGFRLRCKIRYWLEYKAGKGYRFVSQTSNPKRPIFDAASGLYSDNWGNKPKASTYSNSGVAVMYLDSNEHVHWDYPSTGWEDSLHRFAGKFSGHLSGEEQSICEAMQRRHDAYKAARNAA